MTQLAEIQYCIISLFTPRLQEIKLFPFNICFIIY